MRKLLVPLVILGVLGGLGWGATRIKWVSRETWVFEDQEKIKAEQERKKDAEMAEKLRVVTADDQGEYAIWVYRLTDGSEYGFNREAIMPARSVIKVPIIAAALEDGSVTATIGSLLEKMGKQSNNNAQEKAIRILGMEAVNNEITDLGMQSTSYETNETTAGDVVQMWRNLYGKSYWEDLKEYLTDSIYEDRIAVGIPKGAMLVHKVGTDIDIWNDCGVIIPKIPNDKSQITNNTQISNTNNARPFILVILNKDIDLEEAKKTVPEVTKMVWDYEISR